MALNATRNIAKMLGQVGQSCTRDGSLALAALSPAATSSARMFQSSSAAANPALIRLPSLADTGVKFNSARWAGPEAAESLSVFDTAAAYQTLSKPPPPESMTAGMRALADRVARAQQQQATVAGFQLLPDLTPGRAFMWGTIVAVWGVSMVTLVSARALDIHTMKDVSIKMKEHLQPIKDWSKENLGVVSATLANSRDAETIQGAHVFASAVKRTLRRAPPSAYKSDASGEMTC